MFMRNVGGIDRAVRLALGIVLLPWGLFLVAGHRDNGLLLTLIGLAGLVTGIAGVCPPYALFGISTARPRLRKDSRCP
jgi:DUF2892 family protein